MADAANLSWGGMRRWNSPVEFRQYDRSSTLSSNELSALAQLPSSRFRWGDSSDVGSATIRRAASRIVAPLNDAMALIEGEDKYKDLAISLILKACYREKSSFWAWDRETWCRLLGSGQAEFLRENGPKVSPNARQYMLAAAYLLHCPVDLRAFGCFPRNLLATKIFGSTTVKAATDAVNRVLRGWGYARSNEQIIACIVEDLLLLNRSPFLEDLTLIDWEEHRRQIPAYRRARIFDLQQALVALGVITDRLPTVPANGGKLVNKLVDPGPESIDPVWLGWIQRLENTSTYSPRARYETRLELMKVGRWLRANHPTIASPEQWDRDLVMAYVAAVDRMRVGDFIGQRVREKGREIDPAAEQRRRPLSAGTKNSVLSQVRGFFRDCQNWGWIPVRFDPTRLFVFPRAVGTSTDTSPRTIAPDAWAKLVWAGLNLTNDDLPSGIGGHYYPIELQRALAVVWLFAGLRSDEILRLRVGCARRPPNEFFAQQAGEASPQNTICLLDVPAHKTGNAFTKPVDPVIGEAIAAWQNVRPTQRPSPDRKTGELVHFLFSYRSRTITRAYLNGVLIPRLCRKAQVPLADARGSITSHRGRSTIASLLFNASEPMSIIELQAWLGHRSANYTRSYAAAKSARLIKAYANAGYLSRDKRAAVELIDPNELAGEATAGEKRRHYDLGCGLCDYEFLEQCQHRMACIRCDSYKPKESFVKQLLDVKSNLQRWFQEAQLNEEESVVVERDLEALGRVIARLDVHKTP